MILHNGYWNGLAAKFRIVIAIVGPEPAELKDHIEKSRPGLKRYLWFVPFIGQHRQVVEVIQDGQTFYMDNEDGSGFRKVTEGRGSPQFGHRSFYPAEILSEVCPSEWTKWFPALQDRIQEDVDIAWRQIDREGYNEDKEKLESLKRTIQGGFKSRIAVCNGCNAERNGLKSRIAIPHTCGK